MPQTDLIAAASPSAAADHPRRDRRRLRLRRPGAGPAAGPPPLARLTLATGSQASSTPRRLPALARIWDGEVVPLDLEAVGRAAEIVFLALPEAASAEVAPHAARRRGAGDRSLGGVPSA